MMRSVLHGRTATAILINLRGSQLATNQPRQHVFTPGLLLEKKAMT
jgi:hypothetical protein